MLNKLVLFCGPSGSGKTTIVHYLLQHIQQLSFSISATTRSKRENEEHGRDYYFIPVDDFKNRIAHNEFVEWEEVYGNKFYGTLKSEIERIWKSGKAVVFDVDVEGGLNIKQQYGDNLMAVFVMPPSLKHLHERLKARDTETPESLQTRITKAEHELTYAPRFDHILVNENKEQACMDALRMTKEFLNINQ